MCPVFLQANNFIISSSKDEWIKKLWSMYTMEYSSAIRNDKYPPFASTWMELEGIMLSEELMDLVATAQPALHPMAPCPQIQKVLGGKGEINSFWTGDCKNTLCSTLSIYCQCQQSKLVTEGQTHTT
ncbi:uncharacterized protein LOC144282306 isoform X4 [Canis aureus]